MNGSGNQPGLSSPVSAAPPWGALTGLKVIDLTQMLAGPFCTMLLADLGAEVLKVEPLEGDATRRSEPFSPDDELRAFGGYFQSVNRNKTSIAIDLKQAQGRAVLHRLLVDAHVVVENFRVGVMERLGLAYEALHAAYPRLVYACIRGFGDPRTGESPYMAWPAFDIVAQAMGGLMSVNGPGPGQPMKVGPGIGDLVPGMLAALGILAAVRHADLTGQGQLVDVAMYDSILALCERIVYQYSYAGDVPQPQGNSHPLLCPFDAFPVADGWVTIAAPFDHLWQRLCALIERPDLAAAERLATNTLRVVHADEVRAAIVGWTSLRTRKQVMDVLGGIVPCGPVNTVQEIYADPHVAKRNMIALVDHPGVAQQLAIAGSPIKMTETPGGVHSRAPLLGEHTDRVLAGLGYGAAEIDTLRQSGIVC